MGSFDRLASHRESSFTTTTPEQFDREKAGSMMFEFSCLTYANHAFLPAQKRIEWMLNGSRASPWAVFGFATQNPGGGGRRKTSRRKPRTRGGYGGAVTWVAVPSSSGVKRAWGVLRAGQAQGLLRFGNPGRCSGVGCFAPLGWEEGKNEFQRIG